MPAYEHRGLVTRQSLGKFLAFLLEHGWVQAEPKGEYEVLRMNHPAWPFPLIAYRNARNDEVTTANVAYGWALMFRTFTRAHSDAERQKTRSPGYHYQVK